MTGPMGPVCRCSPLLGVNHEARGLTCQGGIGIEGAGLAEPDGDDVLDNVLDGSLPLCRIGCGLRLVKVWHHFLVLLSEQSRCVHFRCVVAG